MDPLLPAAPWLAAVAGVVAAIACLATWKALPWQGRQTVLLMAGALLVSSVTALAGGNSLVGVILGAVLLVSAMLGTVGVRGTAAAGDCLQRAAVALVMAICAFESATPGVSADPSGVSGSHGHGGAVFSGILPVAVTIGVVGIILWTIVSEWFREPRQDRRAARWLIVESWSLAAGLAVVCLAL